MPPPKARPEKVRQHTVPKHYLNGFSLNGRNLVQYDRESGAWHDISLTDASVVKRIYSIKRPDGQWDDSIEDYFMKLEGEAWPILQTIIEGRVPSKKEKCILALYIARQMQRGRFIASFAQQEAARFKDHDFVLDFIAANKEDLVTRYGEESLERALRDFTAAKVGVEIDDKTYLRFLITTTPPYAAVIADWYWRVETAKNGYFATSDQPPCVRRRGEPVNPHIVGLNNEGAELYFPLDKSNMLIASKDAPRHRRSEVSVSRVRELNRITVINAFRFIFLPEPDPVLESLIREHREDRIRFKEMSWLG